MSIKRQEIDQKIQTCRSELKNVCPVVLVNSIRLKIHDLNSKLFQYLQDHKNQKLFELAGRDPNSNSKPLEQRYNVVTIPEDLPLSEPEKSILGKGLNFVPLTKKTDEFTVKEDTEKFLRRVKLKAHFHDKEQPSDEPQRDEFESLKPKKSNWTPPDGQFTSVDLFVKKCRVDIQKLNFNKSLKFSNLSKEEWTAHQNLKTRDDIVIKPADKGGAVVVWRTDLYKQEAFRQLADTKFYAKVNKDLTQANQKIVKDTVNKLILQQKLPSTARNLFVTTPKTSTFYLKPKIHKPNNPGRPIISACSCPTELISSFLDKKMAPFVKSLPTYIKDTNHALNILKQFSFPGNNKFLFTMDITSLYTVIPNNEGLLALKYFFDQRTVKEPSTDTMLRLAELVLTLNCFTFSGETFKQINGVAMGTKMGPNYANLFVGYVEEQIFNQFDGPKPELFGRYIDDCLGATSCTKEELERFIGFVNSFHPALKFTWEISETSVTFLDINISVQDNKLATSVHYKPTDSHSYLLYSSSHPSHVKDSIPYSQFLRLRRLCSEDSDFNSKCDEMSNFFSERGYPDSILSKALNRVQNVNRESALEPSASDNEERIPFTLTFHPNNLAARNVVLRNFKILQSDPETAPIFPNPPLVSFKRDRNLRNSLVRSSLPSNLEPGTFNCSRKVCNTCPFINSKTHIRGPNGSYQVNDHFDCTTSNIIYCITCTLCNKLYIGESGHKLGDRFREHLLDVKNKGSDLSKPVARHFNLPGHSHEHMEICGIYLHLGNNETRKRKEQRLIFKLGTLAPNGINERFSFA